MKKTMLAAGAALALTAGAATASTHVIDFSTNNGATLGHGSFVDGRFDFGNGLTGTVSTTGGSGIAQVFNTNIPLWRRTDDRDLQRPRHITGGWRTTSLGNALIVNEDRRRVDDNARGGIITFLFDTVVEYSGVTLIDLEGHQPVTITADGYNSGPLDVVGPGHNGDNRFQRLFTAPIFTQSLSFRFAGSGAIDNIQVSAVPLPAPALMLLGGLGALGAMRRRKKS